MGISSERMELLIKNGRVFTGGRLQSIDLWIRGGKIAALGHGHIAEDEIDASGLLVFPGAIDVHVHFRDPGMTYKEDWLSGSSSAAAGGVTTVVDQPNTNPPTNDRRSFDLKREIAGHNSIVDFAINGGPGRVGDLHDAGALAIGEIFTYEFAPNELQQKLAEISKAGAISTVHAEDGDIVRAHSQMLQDDCDPDSYSRARPWMAEAAAIEATASQLKRAHICHLSTRQGLERVAAARRNGADVSCEVAVHHLLFNRLDYKKYGSYLKMNPPLRDRDDNNVLWEGLRSGQIDMIASDHAPHLPEEKNQEIWHASAGVPGVETMLPIILSMVKSNFISLDRAVDALSTRPAKVFGLKSKGSIDTGMDADLVLIDPRSPRKIRADRLHSRAEWTPYEGRYALFPQMTLLRGKIVFDGDIAARPGAGKFLPGPGLKIYDAK